MEKFQITKQGYDKLRIEVENLKNERPKIIRAIAEARDHGDLKENVEYHAARERQGLIEAMLADLEDKLSRSEVIDISQLSGNKVKFGATVKLENLDNGKIVTYKIVSDYEADIDNGMISNFSPVARGLMDKVVGDEIEIKTPGGLSNYEIIEIKFL
jgi:transcription elongation factor GreA